jgi:hypothetical protein
LRRNFDLSTGLVAIGAIAVLVSLFLTWYQPGLSAWQAFELADWVLAALAVAALFVLLRESVVGDGPSQRLAWISGLVAFVVIAQLLDPPPAASGAAREVGAWVALAGSAAMVAGAVLALAQISVTIDVAERRRRSAAVDARGDAVVDADVVGEADAGRDPSGLWQRPGGQPPTDAPPPPSPQGERRTPYEMGPATDDGEDGGEDDRTQPLRRVDRPDDRA